MSVPMQLPAFIRARDFEKVYWPSWIALANHLVSLGIRPLFQLEKSYAHLMDHVAELPAGCGVYLEDDMPWDVKTAAPHLFVVAGISLQDLKLKQTDECIDFVKNMIDRTAPFGGFVFSVNSIMLTLSDVRPENLIAVHDFVKEYGKYGA